MRPKRTRQKANPPVFNVTLKLWLCDLTTDEALSVKDCVGRVRVERVFSRVTDPGLWISTRWKEGEKKGRTYSRSSSVKATHEGVIRWPWSLAIISTRPPRCTLKRGERAVREWAYPRSETKTRTQHRNNWMAKKKPTSAKLGLMRDEHRVRCSQV